MGWPKQQLLGQFHHIFWLGDLNYRVDWQPNPGEIIKHEDKPTKELHDEFVNEVMESKYSRLLKHDQLRVAMINESSFLGFTEAPIKFPPTFKVERMKGTVYLNQRLPAWCDRILWRSAHGFYVKPVEYTSRQEASPRCDSLSSPLFSLKTLLLFVCMP